MKLLFIHGAPASGKLTIAKEVAELTAGKLVDNHQTIDIARAVFNFGTTEFWDLVSQLRNIVIEKVSESSVPLLITTGCYSHPIDLPMLEIREKILKKISSRITTSLFEM